MEYTIGLLNSLILHIDQFLVPLEIEKNSNLSQIHLRSKLRVLNWVSFLVILLITLISAVRIFFAREPIADLQVMFASFFLFSALILYVRKSGNIIFGGHLFNAIALFSIPIRVYQTGGIYAPAVYLYLIHAAIVFTILGRKLGVLVFSWCAASVIFFSLYQVSSSVLNVPVYHGAIVFIVLSCLCITLAIIYYEKEEMAERLQRYEKQRSSNLIMRRLTHEIVNPLSIALGFTRNLRSKCDLNAVDMVEKQLRDIDEIVKLMDDLACETDLVATLDMHSSEVKIATALKRKKVKIPDDFVCYRSTKVFTVKTVPKMLLGSHNTKAGVYGIITVLSGSLKFYGLIADNGAVEREVLIGALETAVSPPQYWHKVEFTSKDTTFKIDFYAQKDSDIVKKNLSERDKDFTV